MLDRDHPAVHAAAGAHAWSPRCAPLVASLIERYRAATLDLLSRAYTTASSLVARTEHARGELYSSASSPKPSSTPKRCRIDSPFSLTG